MAKGSSATALKQPVSRIPDKYLEDFFASNVSPSGERERGVPIVLTFGESVDTQQKLAHQILYASMHSASLLESISRPRADVLAQSLNEIVTRFARFGAENTLADRLANAEKQIAELSAQLHCWAPSSARPTPAVSTDVLDRIRSAFNQAFGFPVQTITVVESDEDAIHPRSVRLHVDASQSSFFHESRVNGAKIRFYEILVEEVDPAALEPLGFEFVTTAP